MKTHNKAVTNANSKGFSFVTALSHVFIQQLIKKSQGIDRKMLIKRAL